MRYKTLFRVILKGLGVWFFGNGLIHLIPDTIDAIWYTQRPYETRAMWHWLIHSQLHNIAPMILGAYLFFGGKWIVNLAIPGNRPYCHECGYDLTAARGKVCPECGTALEERRDHVLFPGTAPREAGSEGPKQDSN